MNSSDFPWHTDIRRTLLERYVEGRLPHALLLQGPAATGKAGFALSLATALVCEQLDTMGACGTCPSCGLMNAGTHPDYHELTLPEDGKQLKVDEMRAVIDWSSQTSSRGGNMVAVIHPAHAMNINASNALLKVLEEPTANTYFLLVTDQPARLLPTIRSRCQVIDLPLPEKTVALSWLAGAGIESATAEPLLAVHGGAPLAALDAAGDDWQSRRTLVLATLSRLVGGEISPMEAAGPLANKARPAEIYADIYTLVADAMKSAHTAGNLRNIDAPSLVAALAKRYRASVLAQLADAAAEAARLADSTSNPNQELLLEAFLSRFAREGR